MNRWSHCLRLKDPFPAWTHWAGALLSLVGLIVLLSRSDGRPLHVAGFTVYGVSLVLLYLSSALAHSLDCSPGAAQRLTLLDYTAIFLLIGGTYTPICLVSLRGPWGWAMLAAVWGTAAFGIAGLFARAASHRRRVLTYVAMGWLAVAASGAIVRALPAAAIAWLIAGGVVYTLGAVVFITDRPRLFPGRFVAHDLWHCMVLLGSACHFVVMLRFVAPAA